MGTVYLNQQEIDEMIEHTEAVELMMRMQKMGHFDLAEEIFNHFIESKK